MAQIPIIGGRKPQEHTIKPVVFRINQASAKAMPTLDTSLYGSTVMIHHVYQRGVYRVTEVLQGGGNKYIGEGCFPIKLTPSETLGFRIGPIPLGADGLEAAFLAIHECVKKVQADIESDNKAGLLMAKIQGKDTDGA